MLIENRFINCKHITVAKLVQSVGDGYCISVLYSNGEIDTIKVKDRVEGMQMLQTIEMGSRDA